MNFASDNVGPAHPRVMEALQNANTGFEPPYGDDQLMDLVRDQIRDIFEAPDAAVYLVATGTAANALALATYADPWQAIFGHRISHIEEDECGAPEFFTGGSKIALVDGEHGKMCPESLRHAIAKKGSAGVHNVQRGPVSITQTTEAGTVYTLEQLATLTSIAKEYELPCHLDGARFANACAALGCSPAEMTWKAGIDFVSFGGTKNGCLGVEAVILFDPQKAWEFELRRKRGAHLFSKHRYLSAQMHAYLTDDLWLDLAGRANKASAYLALGLAQIEGAKLLHTVDANMIFATLPRAVHRKAKSKGAYYYTYPEDASIMEGPDDEPVACRLVCDWSKTEGDIDELLAAMR